MRRARARSSAGLSAGVSSMKRLTLPSWSTASVRRPHSSSFSAPVRRCCWSMRPSEPTMRSASCEAPISIENTSTGSPSLHRHVLGDVERKGGLAHRRARRQHDQVALLQAGRQAVEVVEAGAHAGHFLGAVLVQFGHAVDQLDHQLVHADEALLAARAFLADLEDAALGLVEDLRHRPALRIERLWWRSRRWPRSACAAPRARARSRRSGACWPRSARSAPAR